MVDLPHVLATLEGHCSDGKYLCYCNGLECSFNSFLRYNVTSKVTPRAFAIGIVLFGFGCGILERPDYFTRIESVLDFIYQFSRSGNCDVPAKVS